MSTIQTYKDHIVGSGQVDFDFPFPYLDDSHVIVQLDDSTSESPGGKFYTVASSNYTIITSPATLIRFTTAPETGARLRIKRDSNAGTALVDFENGSVLTEVELDRAYLHNLYLNEEIEEGSGKNVMTKNTDGNFEADLAKIVDLADPTAAQDAATKNYVDTEITTERTARIADVDAEETARIAADALKVAKAGDTMTGDLGMGSNKVTSSATPSTGNDLTNKTYVDAGDADQVNKTGDSMSGELAMGSNKITGLGTPSASTDATNKSYVDAEIAATLATGVAGGPIDTANIADDAVTADKLADTTVTPGSYTNTNITVDQQGRITAAATGSAGTGEANVQANWTEADTNSDAFILNKPTLGTAAASDTSDFAAASHTHTASNITDFDTAVTALISSPTTTTTTLTTGIVSAPSGWGSNQPSARFSYTVNGDMVTVQWYLNGTNSSTPLSALNNHTIRYVLPSAIAFDEKNSDHIIYVPLAIKSGSTASNITTAFGRGQIQVHIDNNTRVALDFWGIQNAPTTGIWEISGQITYPM